MKLPQLSMRELFLLVALVAMGCGWWLRERQHRADLNELLLLKLTADEAADDWKRQAEYLAEGMQKEGWEVQLSQKSSDYASPRRPVPDP